jgi:hypothetical protein
MPWVLMALFDANCLVACLSNAYRYERFVSQPERRPALPARNTGRRLS